MAKSGRKNGHDIKIMMASNDLYVVPLTVLVLSVMRHIKKERRVDVYVVDYNISELSKIKIKESLHEYISNELLNLYFLPVSVDDCQDPTYGRLIGLVYYVRFIDSSAKYLYLDSDVLVKHDLSELWDECQHLSGSLNEDVGIFAVQDYGYPNGHPGLENARESLAERGFHVEKMRLYFNAGVFYINWAAVKQRVKEQVVADLTKIVQIAEELDDDKKRKFLFADQDIINLFFKIHPLEKKWNVQGIGCYMKDRCTYQNEYFPKLFSKEEYTTLVEAPYIVHFTGSDKSWGYLNTPGKPWNPMCQNPFKDEFLRYQSKTAFKGDPISNVTDMASELVKNRDLVYLMHNVNRTVKNNPEAFTINFHFVRHGERQGFYPVRDCFSWSADNILNKQRLHDDGLTGFGRTMARVTGKKILETFGGKDNATVLFFTSPFTRCVETAIEMYYAIKAGMKQPSLSKIYVDNGLCEYLKERWFGKSLGSIGSSKVEELFLNADGLTKDLMSKNCVFQLLESNESLLKDHSLLPSNFKLEFEDDENVERFRLMARSILDNAYKGYDLNVVGNKVTDVVFVSHGGVLNGIVNNMLKISDKENLNADIGPISFAHHCHIKYNYLLSDLELVTPFSTPTKITAGQNWNDHVAGNWRKILGSIKKEDDTIPNILEVGSWEGLSATRFLSIVPECNLWCIDHFDELRDDPAKEKLKKFLYNTRATGKRQNVKLVLGYSVPALMSILKTETQFDFVYIDGSHRSDDTFLDAELCWRMCKKNALMLFDDYAWPTKSPTYPDNPSTVDDIEHPKTGIDAFIKVHKDELDIIYEGYQVCVKKKTEARVGFAIGGNVKLVPMMHLLTRDIMMEREETELFNYIVERVQEQNKSPSDVYIFDFSQ